MTIIVIGGTGRIGKRLVQRLRDMGTEVLAAAPTTGVNAVTGAGLAEAMAGADVLIDVSNSPSLDGAAALRFFEVAGRNLRAAARAAGIRHYVVLSIVGVDRLRENRYFEAKKLQEEQVRTSGVPFTILRSTQFFEFISAVVQEGTEQKISISPALSQPVAADDVARTLTEIALGKPVNNMIELAGPEQFSLDYVATEIATAFEDGRWIVADPHALYFGAELQERSLLPETDARIGSTKFTDWLRDCLAVPSAVVESAVMKVH